MYDYPLYCMVDESEQYLSVCVPFWRSGAIPPDQEDLYCCVSILPSPKRKMLLSQYRKVSSVYYIECLLRRDTAQGNNDDETDTQQTDFHQ